MHGCASWLSVNQYMALAQVHSRFMALGYALKESQEMASCIRSNGDT